MNTIRMIAVIAIFTMAGATGLFVPNAQAQVDLEKALPNEVFQSVRASKVYVNPAELPRFGYSNAVVVNNWTRPLKMEPIVGNHTTRDLTPHLQSALDQMEQAMLDINVTKEALLTLDVYYEAGGNSFDKMVALSSVLNEYTASRIAYETNPHRLNALPVRNIYGVLNVSEHLGLNAPGAKIALIPTVLDPATTTDARLFDVKSAPARADGEATFLIGGLFSQGLDFSIPPERQPYELLKNLDITLRDIGAKKTDIDHMTLLFADTCGIAAENLRPIMDDYFNGDMPEMSWKSVEVAGFASNCTCAEIEGTMALTTAVAGLTK